MSQEFTVTLPKLGESITSATIVTWFKKKGDYVALDEPLLEVSTDKVNSEIPSPVAGVLSQIFAEADQELEVGMPLCALALGDAAHKKEETLQPAPSAAATTSKASQENSDFFSPAVLRLAREKGVSFEDLSKIQGTGEGGRISKKDLEQFLDRKKTAPCPYAQSSSSQVTEAIERVKMTSMRKAIAENMTKSFYEAPHATLINEVDVTEILKKISSEKDAFFKQHGVKLTITSFIAKAIAEALKEYPLLNASLEGDTILVKKFVNIGIAVSVEGGLMVPVVKDCHKLSQEEIAKAIGVISQKTRDNKLSAQDVKEGTITLTNFGMSGVSIGVPIIRYPEMAIIGAGAINKKVVVRNDDTFAIRSMTHLSLTFDHRVIDGMYGCGFLAALQKHLESYK